MNRYKWCRKFNFLRIPKEAQPDKLVQADLKFSDVGAYEANITIQAEADIVTAQGITTLATTAKVQREADTWYRCAEVDIIGISNPVARSWAVQEAGETLRLYYRSIDEELTEKVL